MLASHKSYEYKVYTKEGQFVKTWTDVANEPNFTVVINGGFVEMVVDLARQTENFGEEVDVKFSNEVQLWCFDQDDPTQDHIEYDESTVSFDDEMFPYDGEAEESVGKKIFSGYISRYEPRNDGPNEIVRVHILGYHQRLTDFMFENSLGETQITYNSTDPGEIAESILNYLMAAGCPITWNEQTLQKTGTVSSYTYQSNTGMEAVDKVLELTPFGWYWYVDADKNFHLHPKSELAKHTFTIEKDVFYIEPAKRVESVVNRIYFTGGVPEGQTTPLYSRYERQASIQAYGLKAIKKQDQRITLQSTMDTIANNILDSFEQIEIRTVIRVKDNDYDRDNGYNIESIAIGDTCQIRNYQDSFNSSKWDVMVWDVDYWDFNVRNLTELVMQIVEIRYQPNYVELTISSKIPNVSKRIEDINRNLVDSIIINNPPGPNIGDEL